MLHIEHDNVVKLYSCFTPAQKVSDITEFYIIREWMSGTMKMVIDNFLFRNSLSLSVDPTSSEQPYRSEVGVL